MRLLVGLGNPGPKYERTRHNVGFRAVEEAARKLGVALDQTRWNAVLGQGRMGGEPIALLLPQTYMNESGEAVAQAARFWKVSADRIAVVHDEIDLPFGRLQIKLGGGDAGHNGLKSLRQHLGTGDIVRVRIGVGRPPPQWEGADWVLGKFTSGEEATLADLLPTAAEAALVALSEGHVAAANRFNRRPKDPDGGAAEAGKAGPASGRDAAKTK